MLLPELVHFIGIGGAGMAPLAGMLLEKGVRVTGSDLVLNGKCRELAESGARIFTGHRRENLPDDAEMIVFSSAVPEDNPERRKAAELGIPAMRRGEFLAFFLSFYRRVAAVSGSHGKSSVTAMLARILSVCGIDPGFMIGAAVADGPSASIGKGDDIFVTEADESDATHRLLSPWLGIVPNVDDDHAWSVGGKEALLNNFRTFASRSEHIVCFEPERELLSACPSLTVLPLPEKDFVFAGFRGFMAVNARLAVAAAVLLGCSEEDAVRAVSGFKGVRRRMTLHRNEPDCVVMEDYAHHPAEVERSLEFLRLNYPSHHLRVVFQPHRYARLEAFFGDFVRILKTADSLFVAPVFAAWSESGSVDSRQLSESCGGRCLSGAWQADAVAVRAAPHGGRPLLIAVLGAGDIEEIIPYL